MKTFFKFSYALSNYQSSEEGRGCGAIGVIVGFNGRMDVIISGVVVTAATTCAGSYFLSVCCHGRIYLRVYCALQNSPDDFRSSIRE